MSLALDTPVMRRDLTYAAAEGLRAGDELLAFPGDPDMPRQPLTSVVRQVRLEKRYCYRLVAEPELGVVCSVDHSFLVNSPKRLHWVRWAATSQLQVKKHNLIFLPADFFDGVDLAEVRPKWLLRKEYLGLRPVVTVAATEPTMVAAGLLTKS